ncbi:hypothetical protein FJT64_009829 [Amphibalanus amphitrite]|uniref:Ig-like domain-containing protein n=1 Tax=Amphibalanus amphitrite TaxID=1232801 RepID=A0A6A4VG48_AMPAM|nr:hypothetical protein FJT64_009829 [Amphibalanus amphitrite]
MGGVAVSGATQQPWVPKPRLGDSAVPPATVEVQVGGTAFLPCPAASSGHDSPVWIRRKDYHILTGGKANYITDQRFQVLFNHANQDWSLQIKFVTMTDNGTYECQVGPRRRSGHPLGLVSVHLMSVGGVT